MPVHGIVPPRKMIRMNKLPSDGKIPVDRTARFVYNIGDVCVRTFPAASVRGHSAKSANGVARRAGRVGSTPIGWDPHPTKHPS